jgi:hypothetical protein
MEQISTGAGLVVVLGLVLRLLFPYVLGRSQAEKPKTDVSRYMQGMGRLLHSGQDPVRCKNMITILRRWQDDQTLDPASRSQAEKLVREFESRYSRSAAYRA